MPPRPGARADWPEPRWTASISYNDWRVFHPERIPSVPAHRHLDALLRDVHAALIDSQGRRR
jgi:hypothetical protein